MYTEYLYEDSLCHHGIKGQHWGIRRYQNYDGSYTQAGMKRYNKSLEEYNKKDAAYKEAKKAYKADPYDETDTKYPNMIKAKNERKQAKKQLDKDYKHLKQDKLGDQGKKLYAEGHTITGDSYVTGKIMSAAGTAAVGAKYLNQLGVISNKEAKAIMYGSAAVAGAAFAKEMVDRHQAKKLRAYYSHTSKY